MAFYSKPHTHSMNGDVVILHRAKIILYLPLICARIGSKIKLSILSLVLIEYSMAGYHPGNTCNYMYDVMKFNIFNAKYQSLVALKCLRLVLFTSNLIMCIFLYLPLPQSITSQICAG